MPRFKGPESGGVDPAAESGTEISPAAELGSGVPTAQPPETVIPLAEEEIDRIHDAWKDMMKGALGKPSVDAVASQDADDANVVRGTQ